MPTLRLLKLCLLILATCITLTNVLSAQTVTILTSFDGIHGRGGSSPVQGMDGNFYAVGAGVTSTKGTFFRVTPSGQVTSLYSFCPQAYCTDGWGVFNVILGPDGNFYGMTTNGGSYSQSQCSNVNFGCGTVFKITPAGKLTTLHMFCTQSGCPDGYQPLGRSLALGPDGNFYGTTSAGGSGGGGTIFRITPTGTLTTLYSFACSPQGVCPQGDGLVTGVTFGSNGNLFGAANWGGSFNAGTLFQLNRSGQLSVFYNFTGSPNSPHVNGLTLASDGTLYGTNAGSAFVPRTIFKVTESGSVGQLYSFSGSDYPYAPVIQGTDGNLYGSVTSNTIGGGWLYQITTSGALTTLYNFCSQSGCADGENPFASLVQATNGVFYGTTPQGGTSGNCGTNAGCGTLFSLSMGLAPFVEAMPNFAKTSATISILGNNLTGTTSVSFNGIPAVFKVISGTLVRVQVPTGATTGTIQVTTPSGVLSSNVPFNVLP